MAGEPIPATSLDGATEVLERTWAQPPPVGPKPRRGRQIAMALAAVAIIGAFIAGALYVAHGDANSSSRHGSATGTSTSSTTTTTAQAGTTTTAAQSPTQTVAATLLVVACPTSYGVEPAPAAKILPSTISASVPKDLASQLSVYADEAGLMDVLAPTGWDCTASLGADGSGGVTVLPAGEVLPNTSNALPAGSTAEAIVATQNGGCQGCADY